MKAGSLIKILTCGLLCLTAPPVLSQQIRIQAALPPNSHIDLGELADSLPAEAEIVIRRESEAPAIVEQVRLGKVDIAIVPTTSVTNVAPAFAVFDLPFAITRQSFDRFISYGQEIHEALAASLKKSGLGLMKAPAYDDSYVIHSRKPARSPRDFRGTRIGVLQSTTMREVLELAGARPIEFADSESIAFAFNAGKIDAAELPLNVHWPLVNDPPYMAKTKHRYAVHVVIYNRANYARLSSEVRKKIEDAFSNGMTEASYIAWLRKKDDLPGVTVLELDDSIRNEWRHLVKKTQWSAIASRIDKKLLSMLQDSSEDTYRLLSFKTGPELGWNVWFQSGSKTFAEHLKKDLDYDIKLDLGHGEYPGALSTKADSPTLREIEASPDGSYISLLVRPIIAGGILMARPDQPLTAKVLRIERQKLAFTGDQDRVLQQAKEGGLALAVISQALSVGEALTWPVVAQRTGCARIAFSIWSVNGLRPLDQAIVQVPVVAADGDEVPNCASAISGGNDTLLSLGTLGNPVQADAALHFFDTGSKGEYDAKTVAVFVNRTEMETATRNGQPPPVYAWTLKNDLSQFLGQANNLQRSIASAHNSLNTPHPFDSAVRQLSAAIFNTRDPGEEAAANHAKESLKKLASQTDPPVIITRYFDSNGTMQYLPLALFAADTSGRLLPRRLTVVQPLQTAQPLSEETCVDNWDFAIPDVLEGAHAEAAELLAKTDWRPAGPGINWYRNNLELLNFLSVRGEEKPQSTELLLLAHHYNGSITYSQDDNPDRILDSEVQRQFHRGSFAVLAACATSGTSMESRNLISHLTENGVDAVVTSPFPVDAEFGTRFAVSFASVTESAKKKGEPAKLVDLFNRAVDLTMEAYRDQPGYSDMALEFQIVGNHQIKLCKLADPRLDNPAP
jgi:TRAP-type C4-dicarboxylate transport system substrate-binding protein